MTDLLILLAAGVLPILAGTIINATRAHIRAQRHIKNNLQSSGLVWRA